MRRLKTLWKNLIVATFVVAAALSCSCTAFGAAKLTPTQLKALGLVPVAQFSALARQYAPGVAVPRKYPATVTWVYPGWGSGGTDEYGMTIQGKAQFTTSNPVKKEGFLLDVYGGNKVSAVAATVTTKLRQGGWTVIKAAFTAGRYRGSVLSVSNGQDRRQMYLWAAGGHSYAVTVFLHAYDSGSSNKWSKQALIASFRVP